MTQTEKSIKGRRLSAVICYNCLHSLSDETARVNYDLKKIYCLAVSAKHFFLQTFKLKISDETRALYDEMQICAVDKHIVSTLETLLETIQ
jgi:hypothetical protein